MSTLKVVYPQCFLLVVASVPTDMKTVQDGLTNVHVSWRPPTPLGYTTGYTVMYSNGNNTESVEINNESTDNYLQTGLVPENSYNISLIATSQHLTSNIITKHIKLGEHNNSILPNYILLLSPHSSTTRPASYHYDNSNGHLHLPHLECTQTLSGDGFRSGMEGSW